MKGFIMKSLRLLCFVEGISCILLFFVAMPLKYGFGKDEFVSVIGMAHGVLWLVVVVAFLQSFLNKRLSFGQSGLLLAASTLPLGMFWVDKELIRIENEGEK